MLRAPRSSIGTPGMISLNKPASEVLDIVMKEGMEHHYGVTYSDLHHPLFLQSKQLDLPVFELT